ncbi:MAG: FMN-binding protein, partial [Firmicutes bacterium]|nr:FMN-binding protein [Bacillota bacterium]
MEKSKNSFIAPIVVLVVICFVASAVLAGVFKITDPIIQTRAQEAANQAMAQVLPAGRDFTEFKGDLESGITAAYSTGNDAGTVCSTSFNGFGGAVKLMVGVDAEGKVTGIQVMEQSETPGVGSNALTDEYLAQFKDATSADGIDAYSGATFTSKAVKRGVNAALAQAAAIKGGSSGQEKSEHDRITAAVLKVIPGITGYSEMDVALADGVSKVYSDVAHTGYAVLAVAKGHHGDIKLIVGLDKEGKITGIVCISSEETIGEDALKDEKFLGQFTGLSAIDGKTIDAFSGATDTSNAVKAAAASALEQFKLLK